MSLLGYDETNIIFPAVKNGFGIAKGEDGEIQLSVDNVYPLLKALGLNPQNESVMDMVRDACMECKYTKNSPRRVCTRTHEKYLKRLHTAEC